LQQAASADAETASKEVNVGELLKQALGIEHRQAARAGTLEVIPDTHHHVGGTNAGGDQKRVEQALGLDQARRLTAQMRARLAGLFQAVRLQRSSPKQEGHRLDREAVHRIACATPDPRYFSSRRPRPKENTAVVILGDRSGSMDGEKMLVAIQSTFVTAEALELLPGVACAVGFFPWDRQVAQLKDFGEKPKASRFAIDASGGTPMAEALLWAGMKLSHRKEPRKIIVVMTDGHPDDDLSVRKAMERLSHCGIETYGIGILDRNILHWLPEDSRTIDRIEELPKALVDVLKEALVERRQAI
jgi:nitric oxide reductase activation protein